MEHDRPGEIKQLVEGLFRERRKGPMLVVNRLRQNWGAILGEELARKTHPVRLKRETLWLAVPDSGWAYNLQFLKEEILDSVRVFLESDAVTDVRFVVGEIPPPQEEPAPTIPEVTPLPDVTASPSPAPPAGEPMPTADSRASSPPSADPPLAEGTGAAGGEVIPDSRLRAAFARTAAKLKRRRKAPAGAGSAKEEQRP